MQTTSTEHSIVPLRRPAARLVSEVRLPADERMSRSRSRSPVRGRRSPESFGQVPAGRPSPREQDAALRHVAQALVDLKLDAAWCAPSPAHPAPTAVRAERPVERLSKPAESTSLAPLTTRPSLRRGPPSFTLREGLLAERVRERAEHQLQHQLLLGDWFAPAPRPVDAAESATEVGAREEPTSDQLCQWLRRHDQLLERGRFALLVQAKRGAP